jgi:gliding motility-associated-like protein
MKINFNYLVFLLVLICGKVYAQPANDGCAGAINLGTLPLPGACIAGLQNGIPTTVAGTTVGATSDSPFIYQTGCQGSAADMSSPNIDVWYRFTASGTKLNINLTGFPNANVALWSGTGCGNLGGYACSIGNAAGNTTLLATQISIGAVYYISIGGNTQTQTSTFSLSVDNDIDCDNCVRNTVMTATPMPVNGAYQPGQTVRFCYKINSYAEMNTNWMHGVQLTFGAGWDVSSVVATPATAYSCGTWNYYPSGIVDPAGQTWPAGFYFDRSCAPLGGGSASDGNPGNNFGDHITANNSGNSNAYNIPAGIWNFCLDVTVASGCAPGSNLGVTFNTSGDGESGPWTSGGCAGDYPSTLAAIGACCAPAMASTVTCVSETTGTATATPVGSAGPYQYSWSPGGQTTQTATALAAGNYTVTVTDVNLCAISNSVVVSSNPLPSAPVTVPISYCENATTAQLAATASAGCTLNWYGTNATGGVASSIAPTPGNTTSATYYVSQTNTTSGCEGPRASLVVTIDPLPAVDAGSDQTVCPGTAVTLSGTGASSYAWDNGVTNGVAFTPASTATYTVTGTDANGCVNTDQVIVTVSNNITVDAGVDQTVCEGTLVTLSGSGALTYSWDNGVTDGVAFTSAAGTVTYTVTGTSAAGCIGTDQVLVLVNALPTVGAGSDQTVCPATAVTLSGSGASTYTWNNSVIDGVSFIPASTATYTVTGTDDNGCVNTDQVLVTVNPLPSIGAGPDQVVCIGAAVTLSGAGGFTYSWDNGVTDGIAFTPLSTDTYTVTGTDADGCVNTDQVVVTVNPLPTVDAGVDQTVCPNTAVTLSGSGAVSYTWDNGVSDGVAFTPGLGLVTYTVTGTDASGCVNTDQVDVNVQNGLAVGAGADQTICLGTSVTLSGTGAATYTWDNGVTDGLAFSPVATGTYTVTGTDASGCFGSDDVTVTVNPLPTVGAGPDQTICIGATVVLSGTGASTYSWDNGISDGISFSPSVTTTYSVTGTDANGCTNADQVTVFVNTLPNVDAGADQTVCDGTVVTLSGGGAVSYVWDNGITDGVPFTPALGSVTYTVTGTDAFGCVNTDQVVVNVLANAPIDAGPDQTVCANTPVTLTATGGVSYSWDNSVTNGVAFTPSITTTYTVNGTDAFGCTGTDQVIVTVNPLPIVSAGPDQAVCAGTTVTLSGSGASTYSWDNGVTDGAAFTPVSTLTYTVTGTDANGCIAADQVIVTVNPLPTVNGGVDQTICEGTAVTLSGSGATTYTWTNGVVDNTPFTPAVGTLSYTVTGTDANGCINNDQVIVTVTPQIVPVFTQIPAFCENDPAPGLPPISGNNPGITGTWVAATIDNTSTATYTFTPSAGQCATPATMTITVNPLPVLNINDPARVCAPNTVNLTAAAVTAGSTGSLSYFSNAGGTSPLTSPAAVGASGTYYIQAVSTLGCSVLSPVQVVINPLPIADFTPNPVNLNSYYLTSTLENNSIGAVAYQWIFEDQPTSTETSPVHTFLENTYGEQTITLVAITAEGCVDTTFAVVTIKEELIFFIPNTFTPDGDKFNQNFTPIFHSGVDPYDFQMLIFDRWGELIFETHNMEIGWGGLYGVDGNPVQDDTYTWKIEFKLKGVDKREMVTGHVNMLR